MVEHKASIYLREIQEKLYTNHDIKLALCTINLSLHRLGYSWKVMDKRALERDEERRSIFQARIHSVYTPDQLAIVDEMGANCFTDSRKRGWARKGSRTKEKTKQNRGKNYSLIAAMNTDGMIAKRAIRGAFDYDEFSDFIFSDLIPLMNPYPGENSVIVLDNFRIHHAVDFLTMMERFGLILEFLPAYSADYSPIEPSFNQIKAHLRSNAESNEILIESGFISKIDVLEQATTIITQDNAKNYFRKCFFKV